MSRIVLCIFFLALTAQIILAEQDDDTRVKRQADYPDNNYPDVESTTKKCNRKKGGRSGGDSDSSESGVLEAQKQGRGNGSGMQRRGPQQSGSSSSGSKSGKNQAQGGRQQQPGSLMGRMSSNTNGQVRMQNGNGMKRRPPMNSTAGSERNSRNRN